MYGIDLNYPITYLTASLRYFSEGERHIERFCKQNVLLLVFDGVLRFTENGAPHEIHAGEYYIQRENSYQKGETVCDTPKYLYVHFHCTWSDTATALPHTGHFSYSALKPIMEALHHGRYENDTLTEQNARFLEILTILYRTQTQTTLADHIASYLSTNLQQDLTLEQIAQVFNFSKNHIINIFKDQYGITPFTYLNRVRINHAQQLLEVTSASSEDICYVCGFHNYAYFYKQFCRITGLSPRQWRTQKRINPYDTPNQSM